MVKVKSNFHYAVVEYNRSGKRVAHFFEPHVPPARVCVSAKGDDEVPELEGSVLKPSETLIQWEGLRVGTDVFVLDPKTDLVCRARIEGVLEQRVCVRYTDAHFALHRKDHMEAIPVGPRVYRADPNLPECFQPIGSEALSVLASRRSVDEWLLHDPMVLAKNKEARNQLKLVAAYTEADLQEFSEDTDEARLLEEVLYTNDHILRAEKALVTSRRAAGARLARVHFGLARLSQCIDHHGAWLNVRPFYAAATMLVPRLPGPSTKAKAKAEAGLSLNNYAWGLCRLQVGGQQRGEIPRELADRCIKDAESIRAAFQVSASELRDHDDAAKVAMSLEKWKNGHSHTIDVNAIERDAVATYGDPVVLFDSQSEDEDDADEVMSESTQRSRSTGATVFDNTDMQPFQYDFDVMWEPEPRKPGPGVWPPSKALRNPDVDPVFDPDAQHPMHHLDLSDDIDGTTEYLYAGDVDMTDGRGALPRGHKSYAREYRVGGRTLTAYSSDGSFEDADRQLKLHLVREFTSRRGAGGRTRIRGPRY